MDPNMLAIVFFGLVAWGLTAIVRGIRRRERQEAISRTLETLESSREEQRGRVEGLTIRVIRLEEDNRLLRNALQRLETASLPLAMSPAAIVAAVPTAVVPTLPIVPPFGGPPEFADESLP